MVRYFFALCILLAAHQTSFAAPSTTERRALDNAIASLIVQFSDGIAGSDHRSRTLRFGRVLGGEKDDAIALFSLEGFGGSNYHAEYLAVFASVPRASVAGKTTRPYRLVAVHKIGGRGWRIYDWDSVTIKNGSLTLRGEKWAKSDAMCCPSAPITTEFLVRNEGIEEQK